MEGKEQFDVLLGGSHALPNEVHIMKLVSSRASEIAAMTYSIENPQQTKLVFQKLPVYMRRRVMSHNAKRLPRKLREAHSNQMSKSGLPPKSKRPSRRYRRRPSNLVAEYTRRQKSKIWLETHIWHAKRFHMTEKWGYRLADYANDKCFKANYRAVTKHCLMQDISYYSCIEILGPDNLLKNTLKTHCNPHTLTFAARAFTEGNREGSLMFFRKNGYPKHPIGRIQFLWRPRQTELKTIWLWVHPSFVNDLLTELISSFDFKPKNENSMSNETDQILNSTTSYQNNNNCTMNILKNKLNRFRLFGPLTINTITNSLRIPMLNNRCFSKTICATDMDIDLESDESRLNNMQKAKINTMGIDEVEKMKKNTESIESWHYEYYSTQENVESLKTQEQLWQVLETLESPSQLPRNIVLGFTVLDPRFYLPEKRTKSKRKVYNADIIPIPPTNVNHSPIWEASIRQNVTNSLRPTSAINKLRNKCLVPGKENDSKFSEEIMAKIPILLIQSPGFTDTGLGAGMDIVIPSGWAMPFWLAFLLRCTRVGALRESRSIAFEFKNGYSSDINDPDTPAYEREALSTKKELAEKYFRYPPNRRVNFTKLGIISPFLCEWKLLMKEWSNMDEFFVLRERNLLALLHARLSEISTRRKTNEFNIETTHCDVETMFENTNCLVPVKTTIVKKGCPRRFALICMPTEEDLWKFRSNNNWSGPVEKLTHDPHEATRKKLRRNHLTRLKRLRRQRIRHRKALIVNFRKMLNHESTNLYKEIEAKKLLGPNPEIINEQRRRMSELYLPQCTKVRHSCDREVLGYMTTGDFSFTEAKGIGLGYVTLSSLIHLIKKQCNIVLVRNTQTRQYRFADLQIMY